MNDENQGNYYAIIPATVRYDSNLKANEKLLYGEITALSNKYGYCYAKNKYFSNLYNVDITTISRWIGNLKKQGYIQIEMVYKEKTKEIIARKIYIEDIPYLRKNQYPSWQKNQYPIDEKVKDNNINNNNINNKYISNKNIFNNYDGRHYSKDFLESLYTNI